MTDDKKEGRPSKEECSSQLWEELDPVKKHVAGAAREMLLAFSAAVDLAIRKIEGTKPQHKAEKVDIN